MLLSVGAGSTYVKACASVADWLSVFVTATSTLPAACAGAVAVIEVEVDVTFVADTPPSFTLGFVRKPVPLMLTIVLPEMGALTGRMLVTVGAGLVRAFTFIVPNKLQRRAPQ